MNPALRGWILHRLRRYLHRFGFRLVQGGGRLDDLFVSMDEALAALDGAASTVAGRMGLPPAGPAQPMPELPPQLALLAERFALSPEAIALFCAAAAPGLAVDLGRLYRFAWADFTVKRSPAGFLAELISDDDAGTQAALAALHPDGALRRAALIEVEPGERWGANPPLIHCEATVPEPVLTWLRGEPMALPTALGAARIMTPLRPTLVVHPTTRTALDRAVVDCDVILLAGTSGDGRRTAFALGTAPRQTLALDVSRLPADRLEPLLRAAFREARLRDLSVFLRLDEALEGEGRDDLLAVLGRLVADPPPRLGLGVTGPVSTLHRAAGRAATVHFERLDEGARLEIWTTALPADARALAPALARRFAVPPGVIYEAATALSARAEHGQPVDQAAAEAALRHRIHHALDEVAEQVTTPFSWDDVVLPENVLDVLKEVLAQAENRRLVFEEWGFADKMPYGRGLACLFSGPPGTGKTMMAGVLARSLGQALYRVDLSRVVSKWVGETEKNLGRVFTEAERGQVILFFDEADSLFSTRTEVRGAHDRFANMEVNYLLQRMEAYDGMSILATNFERSLDEAFKRRIRFRVHFPMPDAEERARLWTRMLPADLPRAEGIRFPQLGKRYKLSGGNIKNALLRAAFYAAAAGEPLSEGMLVKAAEAEIREMGRL